MATPDTTLHSKCSRGVPGHHAIILLLLLLVLHPLVSTSAFVPASTVCTGSSLSRRAILIRNAAARAGGEVAAIATPFIEDLPIWPVPASIRREEPLGGPEPSYVKFLGLAEVFEAQDGAKLADLFDTDSVLRCVPLFPSFLPPSLPPNINRSLPPSHPVLRHAIRVAMRDDLFIPDPTRSEKVNRFLKDLGSSLHVSWEKSPTQYANLSR